MMPSSVAILSLLAVARHVSAAAAPSNFLLVSGMTAVEETCLVGSGAGVWLESCHKAVTGLRGEEI